MKYMEVKIFDENGKEITLEQYLAECGVMALYSQECRDVLNYASTGEIDQQKLDSFVLPVVSEVIREALNENEDIYLEIMQTIHRSFVKLYKEFYK